jgi:hypothetical protein
VDVRYPKAIQRLGVVAVVSLVGLVVAGMAPAAQSTSATVTVTFTDSTLRVSPSMPQSGPTTFVVVNRGRRAHMLVISGPGIKGAHSAKLAAGKKGSLTVTLRPGAYQLSDPVGLGAYNVQFLDIVKATSVSATGSSSVTAPVVTPPPMCGATYTP